MLDAMAGDFGPEIVTFISKLFHGYLGSRECGPVGFGGVGHLRGRDREFDREIHELFR
jgi:hypothetical protein